MTTERAGVASGPSSSSACGDDRSRARPAAASARRDAGPRPEGVARARRRRGLFLVRRRADLGPPPPLADVVDQREHHLHGVVGLGRAAPPGEVVGAARPAVVEVRREHDQHEEDVEREQRRRARAGDAAARQHAPDDRRRGAVGRHVPEQRALRLGAVGDDHHHAGDARRDEHAGPRERAQGGVQAGPLADGVARHEVHVRRHVRRAVAQRQERDAGEARRQARVLGQLLERRAEVVVRRAPEQHEQHREPREAQRREAEPRGRRGRAKVRLGVVVAACVEIKLRAPHAIDATCFRSRVCAMAWRFHAVDATSSPGPRRLDGVGAHEGPRDNLTHWLMSTQVSGNSTEARRQIQPGTSKG